MAQARAFDVAQARGPGVVARVWGGGWSWLRRHVGALFFITLIGAALRFYRLDRPEIWGDEAATFSRVCGSWEQLFDILYDNGFMPLHYIVTWALGRCFYLTPTMLRLVPALCGTAMIPGMYVLARQVTTRKTALLAAALTAGSAYLLAYSRDAKMYQQCWCFATWFAALLLMWLRPRPQEATQTSAEGGTGKSGGRPWWRQGLLYMGWVVCGLAAVWMHASGLIVIGVSVLFVVMTPRRPWWRYAGRVVMYVLGVGLILGSVQWYYTYENEWNQRTGGLAPGVVLSQQQEPDAKQDWGRSGLTWVKWRHRGRGPAQVALHSLGSYLVGWEWPDQGDIQERGPDGKYTIARWTITLYVSVLSMVAIMALVAAAPWKKKWRANHDAARDPPARKWWVSLAWWGSWIIVPMYAFYCRAFAGFSSPWGAAKLMAAVWGWGWLAVAGALVAVTVLYTWSKWLRAAGWLAAAGWVGWWAWRSANLGGLEWLAAGWRLCWEPWTAAPGVVLVGALGWCYAADTWRRRIGGLVILAVVVLGIGGACEGVYVIMRQAFLNAQARRLPWENIWWPRYLGVITPALLIALATLMSRIPGRPWRWAVIGVFMAVNLGTFATRMYWGIDSPWHTIGQDVWAAGQDRRGTMLLGYQSKEGRLQPWSVLDKINSSAGRYNYCLAGRLLPEPAEMRSGQFDRRLGPPTMVEVRNLGAQARGRPRLERLIVWEEYPAGPTPTLAKGDPLLQQLGPGWRLTEERLYRVADRYGGAAREWSWAWRQWLWRRVYEPVTEPADAAVDHG